MLMKSEVTSECLCGAHGRRQKWRIQADGTCVCFRAFFWLLSLLLSSLVWFIAVKASNGSQDPTLPRALLIFGVFFSVLLQEVFRFAYYRLLR